MGLDKDSAIGSLNSGLTKRREIKLKPAGEKNPRLSTETPLREAYIRAADRIVVGFTSNADKLCR